MLRYTGWGRGASKGLLPPTNRAALHQASKGRSPMGAERSGACRSVCRRTRKRAGAGQHSQGAKHQTPTARPPHAAHSLNVQSELALTRYCPARSNATTCTASSWPASSQAGSPVATAKHLTRPSSLATARTWRRSGRGTQRPQAGV
jgi:hypothetical protein